MFFVVSIVLIFTPVRCKKEGEEMPPSKVIIAATAEKQLVKVPYLIRDKLYQWVSVQKSSGSMKFVGLKDFMMNHWLEQGTGRDQFGSTAVIALFILKPLVRN